MARYRTYTIEFERRVAEEHLSGGAALSELARRRDISRELLRTWARKYEAGALTGGEPPKVDRRAYEAKIVTTLCGLPDASRAFSAASGRRFTESRR